MSLFGIADVFSSSMSPINTSVVSHLRRVDDAGLQHVHGVRRHARLDQRIANGADTAVAQVLVARVAAARIHGAVDPDLERRILVHVGRDLVDLARIGSLYCPAGTTSRTGRTDQRGALRPRRSDETLRACGPGRADRSDAPVRLLPWAPVAAHGTARTTGHEGARGTRRSRRALRTHRAGRAIRATPRRP